MATATGRASYDIKVVINGPTASQTRAAVESAVEAAIAALSGFGSPAVVKAQVTGGSAQADLTNAPRKIVPHKHGG